MNLSRGATPSRKLASRIRRLGMASNAVEAMRNVVVNASVWGFFLTRDVNGRVLIIKTEPRVVTEGASVVSFL